MVSLSRQEIVKSFMKKAKKEVTGLSSGFNQGYKSAIGLAWCWISFEAFTSGEYQEDLVRDRINSFCEDFEEKYSQEYETMPNEFKRNIIGLKSYNVEDMRPNHRNDPPLTISDVKNLKEVLKIIYRVRNNLFHGGKNMEESNDINLVLASSKTLYYILEKFLGERNFIKR